MHVYEINVSYHINIWHSFLGILIISIATLSYIVLTQWTEWAIKWLKTTRLDMLNFMETYSECVRQDVLLHLDLVLFAMENEAPLV